MTKTILCGYRGWALQVFDEIKNHSKIEVVRIYDSNQTFLEDCDKFKEDEIDIILFIGWSWIIEDRITSKYLCLGIHPSDLPFFRGGSPIQHQIIQGMTQTKLSLMTLSKKLDGGEIWLKEECCLEGDSIKDVFGNLISSSCKLLTSFFNQYPNIVPVEQTGVGSYFARRKKEESKITDEELSSDKLIELYNKIRCLTDPYPNAYIEDRKGNRLYFEKVRFENAEE